jgi:hypothetical protein
MLKAGQVLVCWRDGEGRMSVLHQTDTVRRAKAWCRANGDSFDFESVADVETAQVVIVEVKALTRPHLAVVVAFDDAGESEAPPADTQADAQAEGVG